MEEEFFVVLFEALGVPRKKIRVRQEKGESDLT